MFGRKTGLAALSVAAVLSVIFIGGRELGFRLNLTESAPIGLWWIAAPSVIDRGTLVEVCPPDRALTKALADSGALTAGRCGKHRVAPLLKPVAAVQGDVVTIRPSAVALVNGEPLPYTAPMPAIPGFVPGRFIVQPDHVWLFSTYSEQSFDSRYYGPVPVDSILGVAHPIVIRGSVERMTLIAEMEVSQSDRD